MQQANPLTDTQIEIVVATPVDAAGKPGQLAAGSVPTASSDTPAVCTVASDPTGLNVTITGVAPGTAIVTVAGKNPAGSTQSGQDFSTQFGVTVLGGGAVGFTFSFGQPTTAGV